MELRRGPARYGDRDGTPLALTDTADAQSAGAGASLLPCAAGRQSTDALRVFCRTRRVVEPSHREQVEDCGAQSAGVRGWTAGALQDSRQRWAAWCGRQPAGAEVELFENRNGTFVNPRTAGGWLFAPPLPQIFRR